MPLWSKRTGIMLAYPMDEKRFERWGSFAIAQPKLDGERCRAIIKDNKVMLLSSEENVIYSMPHIVEELESSQLGTIELDGELYSPELPFEEIHSRIGRTVNLHPNYQEISYYIFDIVREETLQKTRTLELNNLANYFLSNFKDHIKFINSDIVTSIDGVMRFMESYIKSGFEGVVLRHPNFPYLRRRSTGMMKFKPTKSDTYSVIGYQEEVDQYDSPKDTLGALLCTKDGVNFSVGSGLTKDQRVELWKTKEQLSGKQVVVKYQHTMEGTGRPRFPVFVELL